jgi:hypothetical protein
MRYYAWRSKTTVLTLHVPQKWPHNCESHDMNRQTDTARDVIGAQPAAATFQHSFCLDDVTE